MNDSLKVVTETITTWPQLWAHVIDSVMKQALPVVLALFIHPPTTWSIFKKSE